MTQKYRWLAALALLLAFGAYGVRAEEEEEVPPGPHSVVELLPPPAPAPADVPCVHLMAPGMPGGLPLYFSARCLCPCPCPCPCPAPVAAAAYTVPCGPACDVNVVANRLDGLAAVEYVVSAKMVKAGGEGDYEEVCCPRVCVAEGQTATIQVQGVETPREHCSLGMQFRVTKQAAGAQLALSVQDVTAFDGGESNRRMKTEAMQSECNVTLGKAAKVELKHDADGEATAWVEVTVTEVEREERAPKTACGSCPGGSCPVAEPCDKDDSDGSALDCVEEIANGVCDAIADTAAGLFGRQPWEGGATLASGEYPDPLVREAPTMPCPTACPASGSACAHCNTPCCSTATACPTCGSGCAQCTYAVTAKKPTLHIHIDAANGRKTVEMCDGDACWKASADRLMVHDDCIQLEGNVRAESGDGATAFEADKITLKRKGDLKILIDD